MPSAISVRPAPISPAIPRTSPRRNSKETSRTRPQSLSPSTDISTVAVALPGFFAG